MNIFTRLKNLLVRIASFFISGLENAEPIESQVDAALRQKKTDVRKGIDDYEVAGQMADDIDRMLEDVNASVEEAESMLEHHSRAVANASTEEARQQALLEAEAAAENLMELKELQSSLQNQVASANDNLKNMMNMVKKTDRDRMRAEVRGRSAIIRSRVADVNARFNGVLEGYLNLGESQSGEELLQKAEERVGQKESRTKYRGKMVSELLKQRGSAAAQSRTLPTKAQSILDEALKRAGAASTKTEDQVSDQSTSTQQ